METVKNGTIKFYVELVQLVVYIPTFTVGVIFNVLALWFAFCKIRKATETVIYVVSLIILDTLLLFTLPFKIISYHQPTWQLGTVFCSFLESLYFINMYGSILISVCICVDRYIAIRHPFLAVTLRSPKKAAIICTVICSGIWAGAASTFQLHEDSGARNSCFYGFSDKTWQSTGLFVTLETAFLGSVATMIFCTAHIIIYLKRREDLYNPLTNTSKSVKILTANLITFVVCFTPFHLALLLYVLVKNQVINDSEQITRSFVQISLCWANLNCCLDAICYHFVFKESLKNMLPEHDRTISSD
ncbi:PREDICTED: G-protein coupled receptor 55-like [Gavialis gangeticus]|uniref:G-protein coupled receptor 55-like n=1 Tax=Gavialis gangeticus TaxID=94835 RepID=UPI00092ED545|nr:PREDICTED: G-protein coupled receptor 55-like [Gavialis gangeticus]